jgi:hypothetical protein
MWEEEREKALLGQVLVEPKSPEKDEEKKEDESEE